MKQTIVIISSNIKIDPTNKTGIGGSETWVIEIAKQFSLHGFNVMVFSPDSPWLIYSNVQYIPINLLNDILSYTKVDYFFMSRYFYSDTLNIINKYSLNHNLYIIAHDTAIMLDNIDITQDIINSNDILSEHLQKIIVMSDFGAEVLHNNYNISNDYFIVTGNGINDNYIQQLTVERDNNLFWSSRWERGLDYIVYKLLPILHNDFPDMKVYVAQYENNLPEEFKNNENVVYLGSLNKEELYNEMQKHKVMFYPNWYPETFCITILEAILCDMELITANQHGPATTLKLFNHMLLDKNIEYDNQDNINKCAELIKQRINEYDNDDRQNIRKIMKNYISQQYSWTNIYNMFNTYIFHKYE